MTGNDATGRLTRLPIDALSPRPGARELDEALVRQLVESMRLTGFSEARPVLVRASSSADTYTIIDGNHRVEAWTRLVESTGAQDWFVPVVVESDGNDASSLTVEGLMNLQRPDTEAERLARLQDFLDLGDALDQVTVDAVATSTGIDSKTQAQVRRARKAAGAQWARAQTSLDAVLAVAEFAHDPEAVERLVSADDPAREYREVKRLAAQAENLQDAFALVKAAGAQVVEEMPPGSVYMAIGSSADKKAPEGAEFAEVRPSDWSDGVSVWWFRARTEDEVAKRDAKRAVVREAEESRTRLASLAERRWDFVASYLRGESPGASNALRDLAVEAFRDGVAADHDNLDDREYGGFLSEVYASLLRFEESVLIVELAGLRSWQTPNDYRAVRYLEALIECGYEPADAEKDFIAAYEAEQEEGGQL